MAGEKQAIKAHTVCVSNAHEGQRLDNFVIAQLPGLPRSVVYRVIRKGQVRVNGGRAKPQARLMAGDQVRIPPAHISVREPASIPPKIMTMVRDAIIHQQREYLVLDKPAGLAVHGGTGIKWGLIDVLRQLFPDEKLELVHRLDRDTSGCLLLARDAASLKSLRAQFRLRTTEKRYLCLTHGRFREDRAVVDEALQKTERSGERIMMVSESGKRSVTEFRLLQHYGAHSFVEALPLTGRTHQIRVHAAFLGIPLAGDSKYGNPRDTAAWQAKGLSRLFLHAHGLSFNFPETERQQFNVLLPEELRKVLNAL